MASPPLTFHRSFYIKLFSMVWLHDDLRVPSMNEIQLGSLILSMQIFGGIFFYSHACSILIHPRPYPCSFNSYVILSNIIFPPLCFDLILLLKMASAWSSYIYYNLKCHCSYTCTSACKWKCLQLQKQIASGHESCYQAWPSIHNHSHNCDEGYCTLGPTCVQVHVGFN